MYIIVRDTLKSMTVISHPKKI